VSADSTPAGDFSATAPAGYGEYEINVERILTDELPSVLDKIGVAPLTAEAVEAIPAGAKGAYVLYENGKPVYAGKTDARHGFRSRLTRHRYTIQHRAGFDHSTIGFKAVRIMVFSNFDVEAILIKEMRRRDKTALAWNYSGFGSNDPGHNREGQEPSDFDLERPINIDKPLDFLEPGEIALLPLLIKLKDELPYYFRYETDPGKNKRPSYYKVGHADQRAAPTVTVPAGNPTLRELLKIVLTALPSGWRATVFPGRVILYKESQDYKYQREFITA
jgi:hypothetical protein